MASRQRETNEGKPSGSLDRVIRFCLENKLIVALLVFLVVLGGLRVAPFDWDLGSLPRDPVPVDAIPDIGENQQIVFSEWMGRSPQDVEDQVTYPLTVALLGLPDVKTVRSYSFFGFSSIYVIFEERADFYWSRSRVLEKLNSLPPNTLPEGVQPTLGPDATALGQIFWYTLEGRDPNGAPAGGWDLDELRTIQDWYVRYALLGAEGVSEVASVGGYEREYQIDVDPDAMRAQGVGLEDVVKAVKNSNLDVGARTIEINKVEYVIRGRGFIEQISDIEKTAVKVRDNVPIYVKDIATVSTGPALRRGALDKSGAEAVGGVVVVRYGYNPLAAIKHVKARIQEIAPGLPQKTLADGTVSKVTIVPFYDRTDLIHETLGTLDTALTDEVLVTIVVVIVMVLHLRSSVLISALLPLAVLMCFIAMKVFGVDANIVALSGIAIAIGTMVDMGIVICENILRHLREAGDDESRLEVVFRASSEVGGAVVTAVATTIVSFLPVFVMTGAEGKLFKPLAFTKTFALLAAVVVALTIIPPAAHILFAHKRRTRPRLPQKARRILKLAANALAVIVVGVILTGHWLPLGPVRGQARNLIFVALLIGGLLVFFRIFQFFYPRILRWCLDHKVTFMSLPILLLIVGAMVWQGVPRVFFFVPDAWRSNRLWAGAVETFPGLGKEFMPALDEGSFLYMPTTMPHASIGEALDVLQKQDMAFQAIPEVDSVVGKIGRVDSPLDPAPISMIETIIQYKTEYVTDSDGHRIRFEYDSADGSYPRDENGQLIPDPDGRPFRQWRDHIHSPDDIWNEIVQAGDIPGTTSAPKLQPIAARLVMLQSGMRAPMGVKVRGPDLETIEKVAMEIERLLKDVPSVEPEAVIADRIVGKPYLEIDIDREAIARHGISIQQVQDVIEVAVGGRPITTTVEGRERYGVRIRYMREWRDQIETLERILVPASDGAQIPLVQLAKINYVRGPQAIKSEDTFLTGYVIFDKRPGYAEVEVVEQCKQYLQSQIEAGQFVVPEGVNYSFAGAYENQVRAQKTLSVVVPVSLLVIFMILYLQFRRVSTAAMVFSGIAVAWAGGFLMIWLYGRGWFLDFDVLGVNMAELFQVHPVNLSVAIWVGFLALFGIASDDGVVMCTYLDQTFRGRPTETVGQIRDAVIVAGTRRVRPCLMTTATTILALIPVLTSTGRGSDIMVPMAIPSFGGMAVEILTMLVVPVLYCGLQEMRSRKPQVPKSPG